jgi:hypothetical protein
VKEREGRNREDGHSKQRIKKKVKERVLHLPHIDQHHFKASAASFNHLAFHHPTFTTIISIIVSTTMSAAPNANMTNQEEEEVPKTLESYAALVKQLVPIINTVPRNLH